MIDMTLLPERFRNYVAITAAEAGRAILDRCTLDQGDWLIPLAPTLCMTIVPGEDALIRAQRAMEDWRRANRLIVGIDVMLGELYPDLWDDWRLEWR